MNTKWMALIVAVAALAGCAAQAPATNTAQRTANLGQRWNDGVWNSVLGYHGPANAMSASAGPS